MKWLVIAQLILDILKNLPFDATLDDIRAECVKCQTKTETAAAAGSTAGLDAADRVGVALERSTAQDTYLPRNGWEELIPHVIAIIRFFLNRSNA